MDKPPSAFAWGPVTPDRKQFPRLNCGCWRFNFSTCPGVWGEGGAAVGLASSVDEWSGRIPQGGPQKVCSVATELVWGVMIASSSATIAYLASTTPSSATAAWFFSNACLAMNLK